MATSWQEKVKLFAANNAELHLKDLSPDYGLKLYCFKKLNDDKYDSIWDRIKAGDFQTVPNCAHGGYNFETTAYMFDAIDYSNFFTTACEGYGLDFFAVGNNKLFYDNKGRDYFDFDGDIMAHECDLSAW